MGENAIDQSKINQHTHKTLAERFRRYRKSAGLDKEPATAIFVFTPEGTNYPPVFDGSELFGKLQAIALDRF